MLKATIVGTEAVAQRFSAMPNALQAQVERVVQRFVMELTAQVKAEKLSGQVLNRRSGRLSRSVHPDVKSVPGTVTGIVGTNVKYGRLHEYGGTVQVPAHLRRVTQVFGRKLDNPIMAQVRAHSARFPQRSFLRSALLDSTLRFREEMKRAVDDVLKGRT